MTMSKHNHYTAIYWIMLALLVLTILLVGTISTAYNQTGYRLGYYQALRDLTICEHVQDQAVNRNYHMAKAELEKRNELPAPGCSY